MHAFCSIVARHGEDLKSTAIEICATILKIWQGKYERADPFYCIGKADYVPH